MNTIPINNNNNNNNKIAKMSPPIEINNNNNKFYQETALISPYTLMINKVNLVKVLIKTILPDQSNIYKLFSLYYK